MPCHMFPLCPRSSLATSGASLMSAHLQTKSEFAAFAMFQGAAVVPHYFARQGTAAGLQLLTSDRFLFQPWLPSHGNLPDPCILLANFIQRFQKISACILTENCSDFLDPFFCFARFCVGLHQTCVLFFCPFKSDVPDEILPHQRLQHLQPPMPVIVGPTDCKNTCRIIDNRSVMAFVHHYPWSLP